MPARCARAGYAANDDVNCHRIGAGGHARVLLDALQLSARQIFGFIDPALTKEAQGPGGLPVLGGDEALEDLSPAEVQLVNGIGSVGPTTSRDAVYRRGKAAASPSRRSCIRPPCQWIGDARRGGPGHGRLRHSDAAPTSAPTASSTHAPRSIMTAKSARPCTSRRE